MDLQKGLTAFRPPEQKVTALAEAPPDRHPPATEGAPLYLDMGSNMYQVPKTQSLLFLKSLGLYNVVLCLTTWEGTWSCGFREGVSFSVFPLRTRTMSLASGKAQPLWSAGVSHAAHLSHQPSPLLVMVSQRTCHYLPSLLGSGPHSPVLTRGSDGSCHRYLGTHPFRQSPGKQF